MNVYDFDKTIFYPDSSCCFILYCLKKHPGKVLPALLGAVPMVFGGYTQRMKEQFFSFLPRLSDRDELVRSFWAENEHRIAQWYRERRRRTDVIISASPEFFLRPIAEKLGVALIATRMDGSSGKIHGLNCHDEEKVRRFRAAYGEARIEEFYSDSSADTPMARLAERAFLVKKDRLLPWPTEREI